LSNAKKFALFAHTPFPNRLQQGKFRQEIRILRETSGRPDVMMSVQAFITTEKLAP
jgi:hypothetical protein